MFLVGGGTGQTGAIRHGLSRALENERRLEITPQESWTSSKRSEKNRKEENRANRGKEKVPILQKIQT